MKFTVLGLSIDFFKKYSFENIFMLLFSFIFYFRNILFPKIINKVLIAKTLNNNLINKALIISIVLIILHYLYVICCSWMGK